MTSASSCVVLSSVLYVTPPPEISNGVGSASVTRNVLPSGMILGCVPLRGNYKSLLYALFKELCWLARNLSGSGDISVHLFDIGGFFGPSYIWTGTSGNEFPDTSAFCKCLILLLL